MIVFAGIVWKIAMRIQMDAVIHAARIRMNVNRYASVHLGGITIIKILEVKVDKESKPCESCRFKPECRYAHDFEVEECKDWGAREEDEE